jgi:hypothetical protein
MQHRCRHDVITPFRTSASLLQGSVRLYEYAEGAEDPSRFTLSKTFDASVPTLDCEDHVTAAAFSSSEETLVAAASSFRLARHRPCRGQGTCRGMRGGIQLAGYVHGL